MAGVSAVKERARFSVRIRDALENAGLHKMSYAAFAREFNVRCKEYPVTVHAVRKWMIGEAIPNQERLAVLASWLGVSPTWLRFGDANSTKPLPLGPAVHQLLLLQDLALLDAEAKKVVRRLVALLLEAQ